MDGWMDEWMVRWMDGWKGLSQPGEPGTCVYAKKKNPAQGWRREEGLQIDQGFGRMYHVDSGLG